MNRWLILSMAVLLHGCAAADRDRGAGGAGEAAVSELRHERRMEWSAQDSAVLRPTNLAIAGEDLVIADEADPTVRVIDRAGGLVRVIGRHGGGPGELRGISDIDVHGSGEIAVGDPRNLRISVFGLDGSLVREVPVRMSFGAVAFDAAGRLHVDFMRPLDGPREPGAPTIGVLSPDGERLFTYGNYQPQDHPLADGMANQVRFAAARDGGVWVLWAYLGIVEHRDSTGALVRRFELPPSKGRPAGGPFIEQSPDDPNVFAIVRLPVADDIAVDDRGLLYVLARQTDDNGRDYSEILIYDADGGPVNAFALDRAGRRLAVDGDLVYVLGDVYRYELPSIDVYRVVRGAAVE